MLRAHERGVHARARDRKAREREVWQGAAVRPRLRSTLSYLAPVVLATPVLLLPCLAQAKVRSQEPTYTREMAQADLELIIDGGGREYLRARARLGDHVLLAHEVALAALESLDRRATTLAEAGASSSDAEIERERGRIIAVLAEAKDPADAPRFGKRLRSVLDRPEAQEDWQVLLEPWRSLLISLGPAAVPEFTALVADRSLDPAQREFFISDLVDATPKSQLAALCAQLGHGDIGLEHALRRALRRRARATPRDAKALVDTLMDQFHNAQLAPSLRAASLLLRQSITALAPDHEPVLVHLAVDESASFELRAAALLVLGDTPAERAELEALAASNLTAERRDDQQAELLAWLAIQTLKAQGQARLDSRFALRSAASPRLATLAWRAAKLSSSADWLDSAMCAGLGAVVRHTCHPPRKVPRWVLEKLHSA